MRTTVQSKTLIAVVVVALLGAGAAFYFWRGSKPEDAAGSEAVAVARGDIEVTIVSTGVVAPRNRLEIKPPIPGRVEDVLVREGQVVKKGQILAWMSSTERAALLDAARTKGAEEVARWEQLYRPTAIVAPINGMVIARNTEPGQSFTSNDAVFVMSDQLTVKAQVDETDIAQVRLRQPVRVTLDAYPEHGFGGEVIEIAYDAKTVNNVTTYEVDVLPRNPPAFLRSGMTANVSFQVATRKDVLWIPTAALRSRGGEAYVLVAAADKKAGAREQTVQTGLSDGKRTEIIGGLSEGEKVLVATLKKSAARDNKSSVNPLAPYARKRN